MGEPSQTLRAFNAKCGPKGVSCDGFDHAHHLRPFWPQASGDMVAASQRRPRTLRPRCPRGLNTRVSADYIARGGFATPARMPIWIYWWTGPLSLIHERCGKGGSRAPLVRDTGSGHWLVRPRWNTAVAPVTGQGGVRAGGAGVEVLSPNAFLPHPVFPLHSPRRGQPPGGECNGVCLPSVPGNGPKGRAGPTPQN